MPIVVWNDTLSVGVKKCDEQHQHLIGILNQLYDAMSQGRGKQALAATLNELIAYTRTHFADEEKMMAAVQYAGFAEHAAEHRDLTNQVLDFQKRFETGEVSLTVEMLNFLRDWVTNHIQKTDKKYKEALQTQP